MELSKCGLAKVPGRFRATSIVFQAVPSRPRTLSEIYIICDFTCAFFCSIGLRLWVFCSTAVFGVGPHLSCMAFENLQINCHPIEVQKCLLSFWSSHHSKNGIFIPQIKYENISLDISHFFLHHLQCKIWGVTHHQDPCRALGIANVPEAALCPVCSQAPTFLMARSSPTGQKAADCKVQFFNNYNSFCSRLIYWGQRHLKEQEVTMEDLGNMVMVMSIGSGAPKCPCFCIHQKIKMKKNKIHYRCKVVTGIWSP